MAARRSRMRPIKRKPPDTEAALGALAKRLSRAKALRKGSVMLRLTGAGGGEYCLDCSSEGARLSKGIPRSAPLIEVMGDTRRIQEILEGKKDARTQFLAGGIRVRGDLRYFSNLALELGIISEPL